MKAKNKYGEVFDVGTVDKDGDVKLNGQDVNAANGVLLLTSEDGHQRLCHPLAFEKDYEQVS